MTCDIIIAGESAKLGQPEVKIGIIPGGGGTQRLARAVGKYKAMRYVLTGDIFSARDAYEMGLVSELIPDAEVEKRAVDMAQQIAELPPLAIEQAKEAMLRGMDASLETGLALETKAIQILFSSEDQKEGMAAFIEKREPKLVGRQRRARRLRAFRIRRLREQHDDRGRGERRHQPRAQARGGEPEQVARHAHLFPADFKRCLLRRHLAFLFSVGSGQCHREEP